MSVSVPVISDWTRAAAVLSVGVVVYAHVRVGTILDEGEGEVVDVVEIGGYSRVPHHVHQGEEDVVVALAETDVGVQAVLEQKRQQVPNKLKALKERCIQIYVLTILLQHFVAL